MAVSTQQPTNAAAFQAEIFGCSSKTALKSDEQNVLRRPFFFSASDTIFSLWWKMEHHHEIDFLDF
jgi:hypothetical protein